MSQTLRPDWSGRLERLREDYGKLKLDGFVVSTPHNLTYLTGFTGSAGLLVDAGGEASLLVDGRYVAAAYQGLADARLGPVHVVGVTRRYDQSLAEVLDRLAVRNVGFEAEDVSVATLGQWQRAAKQVTWTATEGLVSARRAIKDPGEVAVLRRAGQALSDVARRLGDWVAEGRTEREVARAIDAALERAGFSAPAFPTIVASGPEQRASRTPVRPIGAFRSGDLVVLDFGGVLDGYCVDLTRMAAVGQVRAEARALFDAVREAQAAALAAVRRRRPRVRTSMRRRVRSSRPADFGEAFLHATGHGLGLEVHESAADRAATDPDAAAPARGRDGLHDRTGRVRRRTWRCAAGGRRARDGRGVRGADGRAARPAGRLTV